MTELAKRLIELEETKVIEIIYDDGSFDIVCRFVPPFLRETLYQGLLYKEQKKHLHDLAGQYLIKYYAKNIDSNTENECQRLIGHLLITEDAESISKLSLKSKRQIAIKRTMGMIKNKVKILKSGTLSKQTIITKENVKMYS